VLASIMRIHSVILGWLVEIDRLHKVHKDIINDSSRKLKDQLQPLPVKQIILHLIIPKKQAFQTVTNDPTPTTRSRSPNPEVRPSYYPPTSNLTALDHSSLPSIHKSSTNPSIDNAIGRLLVRGQLGQGSAGLEAA